MPDNTVVFILSSPRNGSTMLDMVLGTHSTCASIGELVHWKSRECELCGPSCEYWNKFKTIVNPQEPHRAAFEVFKTPILLDSSKKVKWVKQTMQQTENVKLIRLIRDGRDRFLTYKEREGEVTKGQILRWVRREKRIESFLQNKEHLVVRYEDVCDGDGVEKCCEFLGINYESKMREFWRVKHHGISGSKKTYALIRAYHDMPLDDLQKGFVVKHGFTLASRKKMDYMSEKEYSLWNKYGLKLNQTLGYV